jgi:futalosine hydrolase
MPACITLIVAAGPSKGRATALVWDDVWVYILLTNDAVASSCDVAVFAAFHPEIAAFRDAFGDTMRGRVANAEVAGHVVGIGLPMAAVGSAMHLAVLRPRAALLVGTCGAYADSGVSIGEVVVADRMRLVDPSALRGASQFPEPMSIASDANRALSAGIAHATGARPVDVATTLAITVDDATALGIARATGARVEHLEAHAVATACAARGVPFGAVFGVANIVGARARDEWRVHHHEAARAAAAAVFVWLRADGFQRFVSAPQ